MHICIYIYSVHNLHTGEKFAESNVPKRHGTSQFQPFNLKKVFNWRNYRAAWWYRLLTPYEGDTTAHFGVVTSNNNEHCWRNNSILAHQTHRWNPSVSLATPKINIDVFLLAICWCEKCLIYLYHFVWVSLSRELYSFWLIVNLCYLRRDSNIACSLIEPNRNDIYLFVFC